MYFRQEIIVENKGNKDSAAYGLCLCILEKKYLWKVKEIKIPQPMAYVLVFWKGISVKSEGNRDSAAYGLCPFIFDKEYKWKVKEIYTTQPMGQFLFILKGNLCEK